MCIRDRAWTWEHLALTRARVVAGAGEGAFLLADEVEAFRRGLLSGAGAREKTLADVAEMRARLFAAKPAEGPWDTKRGPGGMTDIELLAEAAALIAGSARRNVAGQLAAGAGLFGKDTADRLAASYRLLAAVQGVTRLLTEGRLDIDAIGEGGCEVLLRETGAPDTGALAARIAEARAFAAQTAERVLAGTPDSEGG
jgi:glutamate-ammonia-ligase adenylyltransferase